MSNVGWIALGSIGTLFVVVINLFIIFMLPWWRRPRLLVVKPFEDKEPFCRETTCGSFTSGDKVVPTYWVRLKVKNIGRSVAKRCLLKVVAVMDKNTNEIPQFDPMPLHWVITDWGALPFQTLDLDQGDYDYVDLVATQQGDREVHIGGDQFPGPPPNVSWTSYKKRGILSTLQPGKYIIRITAYGDNVQPVAKFVSVKWDGSKFNTIDIQLHRNLRVAQLYLSKG